jgi:hypothetical protein
MEIDVHLFKLVVPYFACGFMILLFLVQIEFDVVSLLSCYNELGN